MLKLNLLNSDYDVIVLTETWLNDSVYNSEFNDTSRVIVRKDRDRVLTGKKQGGGVMLIVKSRIFVKEFDIFPNDLDAICVKVRLSNDKCVFLMGVYFVPGSCLSVYRKFYNCIEDNFLKQDCIVLGDFNLPGLVSGVVNEQKCEFYSFLAFSNLVQVNNVRNANNVLLDLVIVSSSFQNCRVVTDDDPLLPVDQHHPALSISFDRECEWTECEQVQTTKFNFKKANYRLMYNMFQNVDWYELYECKSVDDALRVFYRKVNEIFVECVPLATQVGRSFPVWYNREIIKLIKNKETYFRKYKRYKLIYWHNKFKKVRALVKKEIKNAYNRYMSKVSNSMLENPKYFWTYVKSQKRESSFPSEVYYNNLPYRGAKSIADGFAEYFSSVFSKPETLDYKSVKVRDYFCSLPFNEEELKTAAKKLKGNRAIGPDGLPDFILKDCVDCLNLPLLFLYNLSYSSETYPKAWKTSKVIPVFKKGRKQEISDYRPITIPCAVSKLYEIMLFGRIYDSVKYSIVECQHGFLPKKSTVSNLINFCQYIHDSLNDRGQVDVIYTDMEKAFDRVKHSVIINSLIKLNVPPKITNLIASYMRGREQYVEIMGAKSKIYSSSSGVPQGSNLGPMLFIIAINDICVSLENSSALLYADDLKVFSNVASNHECECLQRDLSMVVDWCSSNGFNFNVNKCAKMTFTLKKHPMLFQYRINDSNVSGEASQKDLGVLLDERLSFTDHIVGKINESHRTMGFIIRAAKAFDVEVCLRLFDSLVLPKLEYASIIWSPIYEVWMASLERIQRKFLKHMFLKRFRYYPPQGYSHYTLLKLFNRLSLENRRKKINLTYMFKILKNQVECPDFLAKLPFAINGGGTRQKRVFYLNFPRTNSYKASPMYSMCNLFNVFASDLDLDLLNLKAFTKIINRRLQESQEQADW